MKIVFISNNSIETLVNKNKDIDILKIKLEELTSDKIIELSKREDYDYFLIDDKNYKDIRRNLINNGILDNKILNDTIFNGYDIKKAIRAKKLKEGNEDLTIISNTCTAGFLYNMLGIQYNSPTIWMFFKDEDYIKFVKNMKEYLNYDLELYFDERLGYPVGKLKDINIYFNHYKSCEDAYEKFNLRKKRINYERLMFVGMFSDEKIIEEFMEANSNKKIVITDLDMKGENIYSFPNWIETKEAKENGLNKFWQFGNYRYIKYTDILSVFEGE